MTSMATRTTSGSKEMKADGTRFLKSMCKGNIRMTFQNVCLDDKLVAKLRNSDKLECLGEEGQKVKETKRQRDKESKRQRDKESKSQRVKESKSQRDGGGGVLTTTETTRDNSFASLTHRERGFLKVNGGKGAA